MCGKERDHGVSPAHPNPFTRRHFAHGPSLLPVSRRKLANGVKIKNCILTCEQNRYLPMIYTIWATVGASSDLWLALDHR